MTAKKYIDSWHTVFKSQKLDKLDKIIADNAVFTSPVVFKPMEGKEITKMYLFAAGQSFNMDKFKYIREVHDGINSVLEFETFIDDISVNGVDMIKWNNEGKIVDFKVMIRPLKAVQKVQEKMIESLNSFK
ncbi:nuclear transport factor 2 family protein [Gammaproteobacteria bacterium]|nr:nuclear transport factor 2 family protein [Gammaproteobacteria bacterium]MDA7856021.1 nuclear transport factor 2 family protein [Gammaproteobacteria bacterium]MDA9011172.1 nuclear transport factor 2 family protein [Gammaproteobacteria bacterium]MDA9039215.1 nuclear transport factor 2 family protein [Gammaproteobacteria bacterium]MDA9045414.1 nuclear transport factor 2 family protein [Gammaproteobacteria bacterium]